MCKHSKAAMDVSTITVGTSVFNHSSTEENSKAIIESQGKDIAVLKAFTQDIFACYCPIVEAFFSVEFSLIYQVLFSEAEAEAEAHFSTPLVFCSNFFSGLQLSC